MTDPRHGRAALAREAAELGGVRRPGQRLIIRLLAADCRLCTRLLADDARRSAMRAAYRRRRR